MKQTALLLTSCAAAMIAATPALAEDEAPTRAAMEAELVELRGRVSTLEGMVEQLLGQQQSVASQAATAQETAVAAQAAATEASEAVAAVPRITHGAAARVRTDDGWDFRPFGRLMVDGGTVSDPGGLNDPGLGFSSEVRRVRIGARGAIPGGFEYKIEVDFADNDVTLTDAILGYDAGDVEFTVGQHNTFQGLEELTSSRFTSFMERAAFTDAFGFERRVGVSVNYANGDFRWDGGVFSSNIDDLTDDSANAYSFDTRAVFSPEIGEGTQLHLGGSLHHRNLRDNPGSRYRQRPGYHGTDTRFINTGNLNTTDETSYGVEAAVIHGPFHAVAEGHWLTADIPGMPNPTFFGGYVEGGFFLTRGDSRGYGSGKFDRTRPANPVDEGGIGAIQVNARYDYLDLSDAGIVGGEQNLFGLSLIWTPIDHARFSVNYSHIAYDDAAIALPNGNRDYSVDVVGARAEIDF
ncbi:MAG: hypothetical protein HKN78_10930 [Sphingomonadaceae bacterium]|nr:hypothetical protein [Sphingomonadaceae bacterium]